MFKMSWLTGTIIHFPLKYHVHCATKYAASTGENHFLLTLLLCKLVLFIPINNLFIKKTKMVVVRWVDNKGTR